MGYHSDVTIAMTKELYMKCVLLGNIPACIAKYKDDDATSRTGTHYWRIEGWKWNPYYLEVQEIEEWFKWCTCDEAARFSEAGEDEPQFGAIRLGEETGDIEEWGEPGCFDLWINQSISLP